MYLWLGRMCMCLPPTRGRGHDKLKMGKVEKIWFCLFVLMDVGACGIKIHYKAMP